MSKVNFSVQFNEQDIQNKLESLINDAGTMYEVHMTFARMIDPWVPYLHGPLSKTVEIEPKCVRYTQPYARYQYYGIGFNHTKDTHPLASAQWDKVAMETQLESFKKQVQEILVRRARQANGNR